MHEMMWEIINHVTKILQKMKANKIQIKFKNTVVKLIKLNLSSGSLNIFLSAERYGIWQVVNKT